MEIFPDYSIDSVSVSDIHLSILIDGCCLLRNALNKDTVKQLASKIKLISEAKAKQVNIGKLTDVFKRFHLVDSEFQEFYPQESFYDVITHNKLLSLLESCFGVGQIHRHVETYARGIDSRPETMRDLTSLRPLAFHLDTIYHQPQYKFAFNFWIPLDDDCGKIRPGLQLIPMSHIAIRRLIGYEAETGFSYSGATIDESRWSTTQVWQRIATGDPNALVWRPNLSIGDVLIMSSWIPHASYVTDKMTLARRSIELRYHGDTFDLLPVTGQHENELSLLDTHNSRVAYKLSTSRKRIYPLVRAKDLTLEGTYMPGVSKPNFTGALFNYIGNIFRS